MCKCNDPAKKAADFFDRKSQLSDDESIPFWAWISAAAFVFVLYVLMHLGVLAGF